MNILIDLLTTVAVVVASTIFFRRARRFRRSPLDLAVATFGFAVNVLMAALALTHAVAVVTVAVRREGPLLYDFRFYSLLLLGAVLVSLALLCILAAPGIARGEPNARRRALAASASLLAVNIPLMPLQGFAVAFTAFAAVNAAGMLLLRRAP